MNAPPRAPAMGTTKARDPSAPATRKITPAYVRCDARPAKQTIISLLSITANVVSLLTEALVMAKQAYSSLLIK